MEIKIFKQKGCQTTGPCSPGFHLPQYGILGSGKEGNSPVMLSNAVQRGEEREAVFFLGCKKILALLTLL